MAQTGADLVGAGFPLSNPLLALTGLSNVAQPNIPVRSNLEWLGINTAIATNTLVASGVGACVAVPCLAGTPITKVTVQVTATAASAPTHQFAALYAGTGSAPALIAQTTDATSAAIAANAQYSWSFGSAQTITSAQSPNGFIYVVISVTGATNPTVMTVSGPTIGAWGTSVVQTAAPNFLSATAGSALAGTAAATIASASNITAVPVVYLT